MHDETPESYYEFVDGEREVRFLRHDTPTPWLNYLTNGVFTTMISQAGGGLTFYRSPQIWRITRYKFFHVPTDRGGLYFYLRDAETGETFSPTFEPCRTRPEKWESRHGMGYTKFLAERAGLTAELTYFIGGAENALIARLKLRGKRAHRMQVFAFAELGMMEFLRELQWQCYNKHQLAVDYDAPLDALIYTYGVDEQPRPADTPLVYFAADRPCDGYDGDRDEFVGCYRSESDPYAVEAGGCTGSTLHGGDPQFAMQFDLAPGEGEEALTVFLGAGMRREDIARSLSFLRAPGAIEGEWEKLRVNWENYFSRFQAELPDADAARMVNVWNPYQAHKNFLFSRNISYYATGTVRGVGYRDTAQDVLAVIPFDLAAAKEKVLLLLGQQYGDGHTNHYFFPEEGWPPLARTHSDNHLWTVYAVYRIVMEEGSTEFLSARAPFYDGGAGTVLEHLDRAIDFTAAHTGADGLPLMLHSDWNDMLNKVCRAGRGESVFVAQMLVLACKQMERLYALCGKTDNRFRKIREEQARLVDTFCWDGDWFVRAVTDDGRRLGSASEAQAKIWLNSQSWAVLSGSASRDKCERAMESVKRYLDTPFGIKKIHPAMRDYPSREDPLTRYNKGCGENGSVFCHANAWAVIAECMLGHGDAAYDYYRKLIPAVAMRCAGVWRYKAEPYVYSSNIFGPESDKPGLANVSWLTGTSSWMYLAVTQYILGVRPCYEGLEIDPCIPAAWNGFTCTRLFRGCRYRIAVENPRHVQRGVAAAYLDGEPVSGPVLSRQTSAEVRVVLGEER